MISEHGHSGGQNIAADVLDKTALFGARVEESQEIGFIQRKLECCFALFVLIVSAPLLAVLAIIIKLDSPGPVFFSHWRMGKGAKPFRFVKLRTLYVDAKDRWPELYAYKYSPEELDRLFFKVPNDPRVTRVGRWLRRSTFDELPNFFHVLTGDMHVIGPRPEIPEMLPYYDASERRKFSVCPGISGLAQISGRGRLNFRDTVRFDLEYVDNRNARMDLLIFIKTTLSVLKLDGAF